MLDIKTILLIMIVILIAFVAIPLIIILLVDDYVAKRNMKKDKGE